MIEEEDKGLESRTLLEKLISFKQKELLRQLTLRPDSMLQCFVDWPWTVDDVLEILGLNNLYDRVRTDLIENKMCVTKAYVMNKLTIEEQAKLYDHCWDAETKKFVTRVMTIVREKRNNRKCSTCNYIGPCYTCPHCIVVTEES